MNNKKYDLIVCGGGFSGISAAISAAREGSQVLIIDKSNSFGGAAVNCLVNPFMHYFTTDPKTGEKVLLSKGIFTEINDELEKIGGINNTRLIFKEEYLKIVLNRMAIEAGIDILFNTYITDVHTDNGTITDITVANKSGNTTYYASYFIDATGDGDIAAMSGCPFTLGRKEDNLCQPMTLCFRVANVDMDLFQEEWKDINPLYKEFQNQGKIKNLREDVLIFKNLVNGVLHFNSTRIVKKNPIDAIDITKAEIESREQVFELFNFLKDNFKAFKDSDIVMTASEIGVRESRMIDGKYTLTQEDIVSCKVFDDSIAVCNYDIDIHNPEGSGTSHYFFKPGDYYTIPYRCLLPQKTNNLIVAGRCISATHETQASVRIMSTCCCLGQAAGTAAALAKKSGCDVNSIDIKALQDMLVKAGAMIY